MANPNPTNPIKPGETRNPNGRPPKGYSITETIKDMMAEKPEIKQALANKILEAALKGDITAQKLIWNYLDGMPVQKTDLTVKEKPIPILDVSKDDSTKENTEPNQAD